jgi:hypothetical protein
MGLCRTNVHEYLHPVTRSSAEFQVTNLPAPRAIGRVMRSILLLVVVLAVAAIIGILAVAVGHYSTRSDRKINEAGSSARPLWRFSSAAIASSAQTDLPAAIPTDGPTTSPTSGPTIDPTTEPNSAPTTCSPTSSSTNEPGTAATPPTSRATSSRLERVRDLLTLFSKHADLENEASPQFLASQWTAQDDPRASEIPNSAVYDESFPLRYFATAGNN